MENTENKTRGNAPKDVMWRAPEEKREGKEAKSEENENFPKLIEDFTRCERSKCSERSNGSHAKGMTPSRRWKKGKEFPISKSIPEKTLSQTSGERKTFCYQQTTLQEIP